MAKHLKWHRKSSLVTVGLAAGSVVALTHDYALYYGGYNVVQVGALGVLALTGTQLVSDGLWLLGKVFHWLDLNMPRGDKGTAGWGKSLRALKGDLVRFKPAPYWGCLKEGFLGFGAKPIFSNITAVSLVLGTTGSGKDTTHGDPNILAIPDAKLIYDLKGDIACKFAQSLRDQGETVHVLNFDDTFSDILGESAFYNHLNLIADNFWRKGGILDVSSDCSEMALSIYPEPKSEGEGGNKFFREGSRTLIRFAIQIMVLIKGHEATLGDVGQMLSERMNLLQHALWAAGQLEQEDGAKAQIPIHESPWAQNQSKDDIANYAEYFRGLGASIADMISSEDSRTLDSFLTGALGEMADLNIATRAHNKTTKSSFRFSDQKQDGQDVTIFIVGDSSRMEAQRKLMEMTSANMLKEWVRAPNKAKPVTLFLNEITNFKFKGLISLMTWCRAYNLKLILYVQSLSSFTKTYGKNGTSTLLSEAEQKLFLPGQRDPETLELIEKMLGQYSYISHNYKGNGKGPLGLDGYGMQEDAAPLMNADEIRRTRRGILFIGKNRPALVHLPSIAAISPFRKIQGISPFYNKPYLQPVRLRLWRYMGRYMWLGRIVNAGFGLFRKLQFWRGS